MGVGATSDTDDKERELLLMLNKVSECKDRDTANHTLRVGRCSAVIMDSLGGSSEDRDLMFYSAPLHDIGKIAIPDSILNKPSMLTDDEYKIMQSHTIRGYELLSGTSNRFLEAGAVIALSHHEKYDGSGYPHGLKGNDIPLYGRIVAIADVFDALVSERVYKEAWTIENAEAYLKYLSGIHFDPHLVVKFFERKDEIADIYECFDAGKHL